MKKVIFIVLYLFISSLLFAQQDTVKVNEQKKSPEYSKIYYGGEVGLSLFGDVFRIRVAPLVGYKLSPKASVGAKVAYEYLNYSNSDFTANNYGASVFGRYRVVPQMYVHGEFAYASYERQTFGGSERNWVPFLLLGAGYVQPVGKRTYLYAEVLFDVLQDKNSPYKEWEPFVSVGASVGF
jgi:hypothetical protein